MHPTVHVSVNFDLKGDEWIPVQHERFHHLVIVRIKVSFTPERVGNADYKVEAFGALRLSNGSLKEGWTTRIRTLSDQMITHWGTLAQVALRNEMIITGRMAIPKES